MSTRPNSISRGSVLALILLSPGLTVAQEGPTKEQNREAEEAIKPLPLVAIPDDPPPHEGAMFDIPYIIEPPDIIVVEVLEALPGRPITGERLVKPDGTVDLGFYGSVHVRGLTTQQAKVKIIHHLRSYITEEVLGLWSIDARAVEGSPASLEGKKPDDEPSLPPVPGPGRTPFDLDPPPDEAPPRATPRDRGDRSIPASSPVARGSTPRRDPGKSGRRNKAKRPSTRRAARPTGMSQQGQGDSRNQQPEPERPQEGQEVPIDPDLIRNIDPVDSNRVLVDVASYNSKVYFAQGYFGVPARLPWTGGETVLDAINFAGGLLPAAEPKDIHLHRPARGGKPARDYHIDLDAIHRGDARANLQIFPNDRLIVGRDPIVQATAELDRAAAPIKAVLKMIREYSRATRSLAATRMPISGGSDGKAGVPPMTTAEQREADIRAWVQFLRDLTPQGSGVHLDGSALREALLKKFTPPAADPAGK